MVSKRFLKNALFLLGACKGWLNELREKEEELKEPDEIDLLRKRDPLKKFRLSNRIDVLKIQLDAVCRGSEIINLY